MSASNRPSNRVVEQMADDLVKDPLTTNAGADGRELLARNHARTGEVVPLGRQQLSRLKTSLSDRQLSVLAGLRSVKFSTAKQVERLQYRSADLTPLSAARTSRRELAHLYELGLIDRLDRRIGGLRAGSGSFVYTLSASGARLVGETTRRRSREPSLAHLDNVLQVAELVVQLHEAAREGHIELLDVQTEPDCWRPVVGPQGARLLLKPDLRIIIGAGERELHWFVEIDRGTEHRPVLARKCSVYVGAWRDGREQSQVGVFPRVLWVVPDSARVAVIESVVTALSMAPAGMFLVTTEDQALTVLSGGEV